MRTSNDSIVRQATRGQAPILESRPIAPAVPAAANIRGLRVPKPRSSHPIRKIGPQNHYKPKKGF